MHTASSAIFTCFKSLSASEYIATVPIPISLHALRTLRAISPLLAIKIFENIYSSITKRASPYSTGSASEIKISLIIPL